MVGKPLKPGVFCPALQPGSASWMPGSIALRFPTQAMALTFEPSNAHKNFSQIFISIIMKKVAFTIGLAFFALGLFAQTSSATNAYAAKPAATNVSAQKKEPMKTTPLTQPKAGMNAQAGKPADKPATATVKPKSANSPATGAKKHHRRTKAKATGTNAASAPKNAAPKTNKQK